MPQLRSFPPRFSCDAVKDTVARIHVLLYPHSINTQGD